MNRRSETDDALNLLLLTLRDPYGMDLVQLLLVLLGLVAERSALSAALDNDLFLTSATSTTS
jgi:hypothetical protein